MTKDEKVTIYCIFFKILHLHLVLSFYKTFVRKQFYYFDYTGVLPFSSQSLLKILGVQWNLPIADIPNSGHALNSRQNL